MAELFNTLKKKSPEEENSKREIWTGFEVRKEVTIKNAIGKEQMEEYLKKKGKEHGSALLILTSWMLENELRNQLCHFPKAADVNWDE